MTDAIVSKPETPAPEGRKMGVLIEDFPPPGAGAPAPKILPQGPEEEAIEPDLPIIDTHHHLWPHYLLADFLRDARDGHNVVASVMVDSHAMYRTGGPEAMKPIGETEFANGVAAMCASDAYGPYRMCAGIVGFADLTLGEKVRDVLEAHIRVAGSRFKGVRRWTVWDEDPLLRPPFGGRPGLLSDKDFLAGFSQLAPLGLIYETWLYSPQLPELVKLARDFSGTKIVVDHLGGPLGAGSYAAKQHETFVKWQRDLRELAGCPNVNIKLGGLGMPHTGLPSVNAIPRAASAQIAQEWRPYFETAIEAFGPARCMFESNFPVEGSVGSYRTIWNAHKLAVKQYTTEEKTGLFSGTAKRVYALDLS
jgi:predicted TIM-barrel fold metal-dependent hydrolase